MQRNFFHYNSQLRFIESFKLRINSIRNAWLQICNLQKALFFCLMSFFFKVLEGN